MSYWFPVVVSKNMGTSLPRPYVVGKLRTQKVEDELSKDLHDLYATFLC